MQSDAEHIGHERSAFLICGARGVWSSKCGLRRTGAIGSKLSARLAHTLQFTRRASRRLRFARADPQAAVRLHSSASRAAAPNVREHRLPRRAVRRARCSLEPSGARDYTRRKPNTGSCVLEVLSDVRSCRSVRLCRSLAQSAAAPPSQLLPISRSLRMDRKGSVSSLARALCRQLVRSGLLDRVFFRVISNRPAWQHFNTTLRYRCPKLGSKKPCKSGEQWATAAFRLIRSKIGRGS